MGKHWQPLSIVLTCPLIYLEYQLFFYFIGLSSNIGHHFIALIGTSLFFIIFILLSHLITNTKSPLIVLIPLLPWILLTLAELYVSLDFLITGPYLRPKVPGIPSELNPYPQEQQQAYTYLSLFSLIQILKLGHSLYTLKNLHHKHSHSKINKTE